MQTSMSTMKKAKMKNQAKHTCTCQEEQNGYAFRAQSS